MRPGISPDSLKIILGLVESYSKYRIFSLRIIPSQTETAKAGDLIYLDPPYFHTKGRYYGTIDFDTFLAYLELVKQQRIKYMLVRRLQRRG